MKTLKSLLLKVLSPEIDPTCSLWENLCMMLSPEIPVSSRRKK